jgi:electron transport complex protein RnfB
MGRFDEDYGREVKPRGASGLVFLVEMDYRAMRRAPHAAVIRESARQYWRAAVIAKTTEAVLRSAGQIAQAHYDAHYDVILPALAVAAGLGELRRNNILIADRFGSRVRIGTVTTSAPLASALRRLAVRSPGEAGRPKAAADCALLTGIVQAIALLQRSPLMSETERRLDVARAVYQRLAARLDRLPNGFPATPEGTELRILAKIFSPEDAALVLRLKAVPETAEQVARRLKRPVAEVRSTLEAMAGRGQILATRLRGRRIYMMLPFVFGFYEFQLDRLDRELAGLFEAYLPAFAAGLGAVKPAVGRVLPVNATISARPEVLQHEDVRAMLGAARSFRVMECICRKERGLEGHPCRHPHETCLAFSSRENAYEDGFSLGRAITRDEALEVIDLAEREGLVHCTYNVQQESIFVCNCCSCCCGFLRLLRDFDAPHALARSNYVAVVDAEACTDCGACLEDRCPMAAIIADDGGYRVLAERCIGCGVCTVVCPTEAITLAARPAEERTVPPRTVVQWALERADNRFGRIYGLGVRGWLAWQTLRGALQR